MWPNSERVSVPLSFSGVLAFLFLFGGAAGIPPPATRFECCFSSFVHICARKTAASQYRLMPQQRLDTSSLRRGFANRVSIQRRRTCGIFELWSSLLSGTDTAVNDCVSGSDSYSTEMLYKPGGNG